MSEADDPADDLLARLRMATSQPEQPVLPVAQGGPLQTWCENCPYDRKVRRREDERTERVLQIELLKLQRWVTTARVSRRSWASAQRSSLRPSPTDLASQDPWGAYTAAKIEMFRATDTADAPWTGVKSNDKRRGGWRRSAICCGGSTAPARTPRPWAGPTP